MAANPQIDTNVFAVARFQSCAADLRFTAAHLQAIEEEMADALQEMRRQGESPERLLIAGEVLADLRAALGELGYTRRSTKSGAPGGQPIISL